MKYFIKLSNNGSFEIGTDNPNIYELDQETYERIEQIVANGVYAGTVRVV